MLDIVRHNDSHNVVTLFTRSRGRMAFLVPVGKSKAGKMRNAILTLMAEVSADVNIRAGKELYTLRSIEPLRLWHGIYANPVKTSLIFFLAEFCHRLVRQYPEDPLLWDYIHNSLDTLEALPSSRIANFHIAFLVRMLPLAGIEPRPFSWQPGDRFDMLNGEPRAPVYPPISSGRTGTLLTEEESRHIPMLMRINYRNMHLFRMDQETRRHTLDRILDYYAVHLPIGEEFRTLPVLRELFS